MEISVLISQEKGNQFTSTTYPLVCKYSQFLYRKCHLLLDKSNEKYQYEEAAKCLIEGEADCVSEE